MKGALRAGIAGHPGAGDGLQDLRHLRHAPLPDKRCVRVIRRRERHHVTVICARLARLVAVERNAGHAIFAKLKVEALTEGMPTPRIKRFHGLREALSGSDGRFKVPHALQQCEFQLAAPALKLKSNNLVAGDRIVAPDKRGQDETRHSHRQNRYTLPNVPHHDVCRPSHARRVEPPVYSVPARYRDGYNNKPIVRGPKDRGVTQI